MTIWNRIYELRVEGKIPRDWRRSDIEVHLRREFKPNHINSTPSNSCISKEGNRIGDSVKKGIAPKVWSVERGLFRLIKDPEDDAATQESEMNRAQTRAAELRSQNGRAAEQTRESTTAFTAPSARPGPETQSVPGSPDLYQSIAVALTPTEVGSMDGLSTENKALEIVCKHLRSEYGDQVEIELDRDGADLRVSVGGQTERIEVKGTESSTLAWPQLKVSSQKSHDALVSGDASMYRVVEVSSANPRIYFLTHGKHFTLEPEPRWAVKRVPQGDSRYPLRGEPYRYDRPFDPVAEDEWEALG